MPFFEPKEEQIIQVDYSQFTPISVISVFSKEGRLKPVYASLVDLYGNVCKTKIEGIKYTKDVTGGLSFCCLYKSGNRLRECMITFYVMDHIWVLENK